jgi:fibronectin type 3 domain-containing protein
MDSWGSDPRRTNRRWIRGALVAVLVAAGFAVPASAGWAASPPVMTAAALNTAFNAYGDAGGHWTGGDGTTSVALPDGRVAWLFSDTFLGTVNADHSRPASTPLVNNSIVVQNGTTLGATLTGGTATEPTAVVLPSDGSGDFFWNGDGIVEGGVLKVLYNRYHKTGTGPLDFTRTGTALATFALPALTLTSVSDLSVGSDVAWNGLLSDGSYTYIYGSSSAPGRMNFGHVARAAAGSLGGAWQYWSGTAWTSSPSAAARLISGVGTNYSVQKVGSQYVLVAEDTDLVFDPQIVAYTATAPTGPWTGPTILYTAPEPVAGSSKIVYDAKLHPSLASPGKLLMSYNVNSLTYADNLADAHLYRPRFVDISWPIPAATGTPAAPTGLAVTAQDTSATLTWSAVSGATSYRVWQQDVTAGQTHFIRQPAAVTATTSKVGLLIPGHQYKFKVTAANTNGEGAFSTTVTAIPQSTTPVATAIRQANEPDTIAGTYVVRLKGAAAAPERLPSYASQLVAQAGGTLRHVMPRALHGFSANLTQQQAINLAADPDVLDVAQDLTLTATGIQVNPPWHLDRIDQRDRPLDKSYSYPNDGKVRAYVVDSGLRATHQAFTGRTDEGINSIFPEDPEDTSDCGIGHGTGVASMLGGGSSGSAKGVTIIPIKAGKCNAIGIPGFAADDVEYGVEYALEDSKGHDEPAVINMSLGLANPRSAKTTFDDVAETAAADGVTVVVAAGNEQTDACNVSPARTSESSDVITVGATDSNDALASFSNYGSCVTLSAPGVAVSMADAASDTGVRTDSGTSYAAPLVAGAAAMVLAAHPSYSPAEVRQALVAAASKNKITGLTGAKAATPNLLLYVEQPPTTAPTGLTATAQSNGNIALSWTGTGDQGDQYQVYSRDVTAGEPALTAWTDPTSGTSAIATGLQEGHTYEYQVAVSNTAGIGPKSAVASAVSHLAPPPAPTGLTATAQTDGQIKLSWNVLSSDVFYWVYQRDVTAGETTFTKLAYPVLATTITAGYLADGDTYEYAVTAANAGGEGPKSATARATANYPPPAAPSGLVATATNATVNLSWTASPTAGVWYWVYQRDVTAGQTTFTQLAYPVTTCCTASLGLLTNGDTYEFKVTAIGSGGKESTASDLARATPSLPVPGAPTGLTAVAGTDGSIKLAWTSPGGDLWYDIWERDVTAGQATFTKLAYPVTTCCTWTATALTQNHAYEFKVDAINATGAGATSAVAGATSHYNPPGAPTNLRGSTAGDGSINLNWDAPGSGGFYYWIYYRDVTAGAAFAKSIYPTGQSEATLGGLVNGHVYEYKVTAENAGGEGPASATIQVTSKGGTPTAPSGLTATAGNGQAVLKWTASSTPNALYYLYQRDSSTNQSWQKGSLPISGTTFTPTSLVNGDTYQWKVTAANSSGESTASNVASAKPMPPLPAAPSGLTATAGDGKVTLKWTASSTAGTYYWLDSRPAGGTWKRAIYPIGTCCTFVYSGLANGTTYEFRLEATNVAGDSAASNTASAKPMPPIPAAPSGLTAMAGDGQVTLKWTASSTANVYYWLEMQSSGGSWTRLKYPISTCCSYTERYLTDGTTYSFRLRATNLAGDSAASNTATAKPLPPFPTAPGTPNVSQLDGVARLSWSASSPSSVYYAVQVRDVTRGGSWYTALQFLTGTNAAVHWLTGGDQYQFRINASNLAGTSIWSGAATTRMGYTFAGILCKTYTVKAPGGTVGWTDVTTSATGVAPLAHTDLTVTRTVYDGDQWWTTRTDGVTSDASGRWSVAADTHEVWFTDGPFRLYVTVRGPGNSSWEDASNHCG